MARVCASPVCSEVIPPDAPHTRKYHTVTCRNYAAKHRHLDKLEVKRARAAGEKIDRPEEPRQARRGPLYEIYVNTGIAARVALGEIDRAEALDILQTIHPKDFATAGRTHMSQWFAAYEEDQAKEKLAATQHISTVHDDELLNDFAAFRREFFTTTIYHEGLDVPPEDVPYLTPAFHKRWGDRIRAAMAAGKRLMILSPPRHGKSDFLLHYCAWMICRNPNIRILWVGGTEDVAMQSVDAVRDILETNEALIERYAGVEGFKPSGRGRPWGGKKFTVRTRTANHKSPTMRAVGRGTKTLSRDADLIVVDDIVDHDRSKNAETRDSDHKWIKTQIGSRKMAHTAVVVIGSRQHSEDVYQQLLDNPQWEAIVESAHDPACVEPLDKPELHTSCVLFPEINPFEHLMEQKEDFGLELFGMVFQNDPADLGVRVFDRPLLAGTRNENRRIGDVTYEITPGVTLGACDLIAGIDPASSGTQVCFLWAIHAATATRFVLDMEDEEAGGIPGFKKALKGWYEKYYLTEWVLESNAHQEMWIDDEVRNFASANGITIHTRNTGAEKGDTSIGVTGHATLMKQDSPLPAASKRIDIPYFPDPETRRKAEKIIKGYLTYEGNVGRKRGKTDIVMAAWIPEPFVRARITAARRELRTSGKRRQVVYGYSTSLTGGGL